LPSINRLYHAYKDQGFVVLGVDIREPKGVVERAARERGYAFPMLLDSTAEAAVTYQVRATPTVYLVDRRGKLAASAVGARPWDSEQGRRLLQELLAAK
jgi:peroxiredoxin